MRTILQVIFTEDVVDYWFHVVSVDLEFQKVKVDGSQIKVESTVNLFGKEGRLIGECFQSEVTGQQTASLLKRPDVIIRASLSDRLGQAQHLFGSQWSN